jgi:hypothetical protein
MAPHIVAWGLDDDKRSISPVPSTVGSIVSIESIASDTSHSVTPEVSRRRSMDSFLRRKVPPGVHLAVDSPFVRHEKYFFQDGNITFLVRECSTIGSHDSLSYNNLRSMAPFTASTGSSSLVTPSISPAGLTRSVSVSTRLFPSSYRWEMSNAGTLRLSFLSYIPSEFDKPFLTFFNDRGVSVISRVMTSHTSSGSRYFTFPHAGVSPPFVGWPWGLSSPQRHSISSF